MKHFASLIREQLREDARRIEFWLTVIFLVTAAIIDHRVARVSVLVLATLTASIFSYVCFDRAQSRLYGLRLPGFLVDRTP
jgi:hypothetical protein